MTARRYFRAADGLRRRAAAGVQEAAVYIKVTERHMINPESSDPNDPETDMWWVWIPIFLVLFMIFMAFVFGRDNWYETLSAVTDLKRLG